MKKVGRQLVDILIKGHFSLLLLTLLAMFLIVPLVPADLRIIERLMSGFGILVMISCMRTAADSRGLLIVVVFLGLLNVAFKGVEAFGTLRSNVMIVTEMIVSLIYYMLVFFIIMRRVLDRTPVKTDKIFGAVSAYLLIGLIWAVVFALFESVQPGSFSIPDSLASDKAGALWTIYFSFVSLTTVGYGDITPLTPAAQAYAFLEAVFGQIFLTVLVARLVALHIMHNTGLKEE